MTPELGLTMDERDAEREPGCYWVIFCDDWTPAEWARWAGKMAWLMPGNERPFDSGELEEIDERRLVRVLP